MNTVFRLDTRAPKLSFKAQQTANDKLEKSSAGKKRLPNRAKDRKRKRISTEIYEASGKTSFTPVDPIIASTDLMLVDLKDLYILDGAVGNVILIGGALAPDEKTIDAEYLEDRYEHLPKIQVRIEDVFPKPSDDRNSEPVSTRLKIAVGQSLATKPNQPRLRSHYDALFHLVGAAARDYPIPADDVSVDDDLADDNPVEERKVSLKKKAARRRRKLLAAQAQESIFADMPFADDAADNSAKDFNPYKEALFQQVGDGFVLHSSVKKAVEDSSDDDEKDTAAPTEKAGSSTATTRSKQAKCVQILVGTQRSEADMAILSEKPFEAPERGGTDIHSHLLGSRDFLVQLETPYLLQLAGNMGSISILQFVCGSVHFDPMALRKKTAYFYHSEKEPKGLPVEDWLQDSVNNLKGALANFVAALAEVFLMKDEIVVVLLSFCDRVVTWANSVPRSSKVLRLVGTFAIDEVNFALRLRSGPTVEALVAALNKIDVGHVQHAHVVASMLENFKAHELRQLLGPPSPYAAVATTHTTTPASKGAGEAALVTPSEPRQGLSRNQKKKKQRGGGAGNVVATAAPPSTHVANTTTSAWTPRAERPCAFFFSTIGCVAARKADKKECPAQAHRPVTGQAKEDLLNAMKRLHLTPSADF